LQSNKPKIFFKNLKLYIEDRTKNERFWNFWFGNSFGKENQ